MTASYDPSAPVRAADVEHWYAETDVVVVGMGAAGCSAALEAAEAGAEVMVLELASAAGGTTALAGGLIYMGGGTPVQQACGFDDSIDDMYRYMLSAAGPNADVEKVRRYCEGSLEQYAWLEAQGVVFNPVYYPEKDTNTPNDEALIYSGNEACTEYRKIARPAPRGHKPKAMGEGGGTALIQALTAALEKTSARIVCDARVLTTITDAGRVVGVMVRIDGAVRAVKARRGTILCAGGFIFNEDMVRQHAPWMTRLTTPLGNPGDDGTGIRLGLGAGGAAINMSEGFVCLPFYPPAPHVKGIMINEQGQRFVNEDCYHGRMGRQAMLQSNGKVYLIVDGSLYEEPPEYANMPILQAAETIAELEQDLELPANTLTHTVTLYNEHAARGEDPLFHKHAEYLQPLVTPPFVALDCRVQEGGCMYSGFTFGGLDTRYSGEVLNASGQEVPGLYAAGRNAAGIPRSGEFYASGMSIGDALFSGRWAGRSAAANVAWEA